MRELMPFFGEFLPDLYIDRERIVQVIEILLDNAVKASPAGGRVTLTLREAGQMLQVEVVDHGAGIALEDQAAIWKRAERGRGLAFVDQVVKAHNGRVWLTSQPDEGSTFAFSLPKPELSGMGDFIPSFENSDE